MHGDMFRLCLQPSSGQLVVQIRYMVCVRYGIPYLYLICTTSWSEDGCKHSQNVSPCINQHIVGILKILLLIFVWPCIIN